jgi:hypothetical protein
LSLNLALVAKLKVPETAKSYLADSDNWG